MKAASEAEVLIEKEDWSVLEEGWTDQDLDRYCACESAI